MPHLAVDPAGITFEQSGRRSYEKLGVFGQLARERVGNQRATHGHTPRAAQSNPAGPVGLARFESLYHANQVDQGTRAILADAHRRELFT